MTEIFELSSDSNDTIILDVKEIQNKSSEEDDVEFLVNKYISENHSESENIDIQLSFDKDMDEHAVKKKRKKCNSEKFSTSFSSSSETEVESKVLQELQQKYSTKTEEIDMKELKKQDKELEKQKKTEAKQLKKKEIEQQKLIKKTLNAVNKNIQPSECKKFITVLLDNDLKNEDYCNDIINSLQETEVGYKFQSQIISHTITWNRKVDSHTMDDEGNLMLHSEEQPTDQVLLIMNCRELIDYISTKSFCDYIKSLKSMFNGKKLTLGVFGLKNYYRHMKNQKRHEDVPNVSKTMIEYGLTEIQLLCSCSHRLFDSASELGLFVAQMSKAVAEIPFKQQRHEKFQQTDWFVAGDNRDCVKVDKNGIGLSRLWRQMLTTFPLARLETAEAITAQYPTVSSLMKAYSNLSAKEGELLLQDIPVRRAAGPLATTRKIGPELSKKIYNFLTSIEGDTLI